MIDGKYKIDFPPDTYLHVLKYGLDLSRLEHLLITHSHSDHFYPQDMALRREPFAHLKEPLALHVYGDQYVREGLENEGLLKWPDKIVFHQVEAFVPFVAGDMEVIPLKADHYPERNCYNYLLNLTGKAILYGLDTGWFPDQTWDALSGRRLDLSILDCTQGPHPGSKYHMGIDAVIRTREKLLSMGVADDDTVFVATHFSHNGGYSHAELEEALGRFGILVAYDGMKLEL